MTANKILHALVLTLFLAVSYQARCGPAGAGNFDAVVSFTGENGAERTVDGTGVAP